MYVGAPGSRPLKFGHFFEVRLKFTSLSFPGASLLPGDKRNIPVGCGASLGFGRESDSLWPGLIEVGLQLRGGFHPGVLQCSFVGWFVIFNLGVPKVEVFRVVKLGEGGLLWGHKRVGEWTR